MASENPNPNEALAAARQRLQAGRNKPCPCGSGKKYKKCCLARDEALVHEAAQRLQPAPVSVAPGAPAEASFAKPLSGETRRENDSGIDAEAQEDEFSESLFERHTHEAPGAPPEVDENLERTWDEFEKLSSPGLEEINALLDKLFSLPPEATLWSEVFHTIACHQPAALLEIFQRIAGNVPHTKETGMG
jgi:hypothetical protein